MTRLALILVAIWVAAHYALIPALQAWDMPTASMFSVHADMADKIE